jgi:hypothetical protein
LQLKAPANGEREKPAYEGRRPMYIGIGTLIIILLILIIFVF